MSFLLSSITDLLYIFHLRFMEGKLSDHSHFEDSRNCPLKYGIVPYLGPKKHVPYWTESNLSGIFENWAIYAVSKNAQELCLLLLPLPAWD